MKRLSLGLALIVQIVISGCQWTEPKKSSTLLIVVDSLGFEQTTCSEKKQGGSGFEMLCTESVRFTHAYTPSSLAQPALASLLTARYPHEHGVWHNGAKFLSAKTKTLAENAIEAGYRTSLFSGGAPIWSYSGLNQGFESFSDFLPGPRKKLYRPAKDLFQNFLGWFDRESSETFFSVLYLADLQFPQSETVSDFGDLRPRTFESQLAEVDESLAFLFKELKKRKAWDGVNIVLAGLNGTDNHQKPNEIKGLNVFSSNTKVSLYMKPARKRRDLGIQWKIDKNVSLVDVGATLFELIGQSAPSVPGRRLEVVSLLPVMKEPVSSWSEDRMILTESAWSQWKNYGNSRFAMRVGHLLFVFDGKLNIFNTFVDHLETAPIQEGDEAVRLRSKKVLEYFTEKGFQAWTGVNRGVVDKIRIGADFFKETKSISPEVYLALQGLHERRPWDDEVVNWLAMAVLQRQNWRELRRMGRKVHKREWVYFANRALGRKPAPPTSGCLSLFSKIEDPIERPSPKVCEDKVFIDLLMWISHKKAGLVYDRHRNIFLRNYVIAEFDKRVFEENSKNDRIWNVKNVSQPSLSDLALALPEFQKERKIVQREVSFKTSEL